MRSSAKDIQKLLRQMASPELAAGAARFFKTGPGEYGEGDTFIGIRVPDLRKVATQFRDLPLEETEVLIQSPVHEERLLALLILVKSLHRCDDDHRQTVYDFYFRFVQFVNNWDLVDTSAPTIVGGFLESRSRRPLAKLAKSPSLWQRRIAIVTTQHFIRLDQFADTLSIAGMLLADKEDLIHKACGWMLREVGERDVRTLERFLDQHAPRMPRTMLRYSIEHFSADQRQCYLRMRAC